ncbi:MAG TPA: pseudouridine synthase [Nannocystaceae bacterium]|nr:pseudouridine synthase [Nannocystaceae bacterium]
MPRLDILLARNLGISRSRVTRLLRAGLVREPGGARLDDGRRQLAPATLPVAVEVDGVMHELHHRVELLQHKPLGVVTALSDARHRTAYELLAGAPLVGELRAVGRLDLDTSGLLLWTTDGVLLHRLTHPRWAVPRRYHAALAGPWRSPPADLALADGHRPNITELAPLDRAAVHPGLVVGDAASCFATIEITSGRFHEVRRIFAELGTLVVALCRVQYGPVELPLDLAAGAHVPIDLRAHFRGLAPTGD